MPTVAVTTHAVERYQQRVPGGEKLDQDSVRSMIRMKVEEAFSKNTVKDHPGHPERRMIQFQVGPETIVLALGPNTTDFPGEWAVIGVLFDRELGQKSMGTTLGDLISDEKKQELVAAVKDQRPQIETVQYLVRIGGSKSKEIYEAKDEAALVALINRRDPTPEDVEIFERSTVTIRRTLTLVKK